MTEQDRKREIIRRALVSFWSCQACHALGWDSSCTDKNNCGKHLYKLLKDWFNSENKK